MYRLRPTLDDFSCCEVPDRDALVIGGTHPGADLLLVKEISWQLCRPGG
jgi:hypothetical protein